MATVDPGLMDRVLDRMGLPDSVDITPESLAQVYDARRVSGNMVGVGDFDEPNHGSVAVVPDGIRTIGRGKLITIDANANANVIVDDLTPDGRREALVTTFGLSEEIADRLPPDSTEGLALG